MKKRIIIGFGLLASAAILVANQDEVGAKARDGQADQSFKMSQKTATPTKSKGKNPKNRPARKRSPQRHQAVMKRTMNHSMLQP